METVADVAEWLTALLDAEVWPNPDDPIADYMDFRTDEPVFTTDAQIAMEVFFDRAAEIVGDIHLAMLTAHKVHSLMTERTDR